MKQFKGFYLFGIILAMLLFLGVAPSTFAQDYYVGVSLPLSGENEKDGKAMLNAINWQVDKINAENKINGKIQIIAKDDQNKPDIAKQVADGFIAEGKVLSVIGSYYSSTLMDGGAMAAYDKAGIIVISPYEFTPDPEKPSKWGFSMNYSDAKGGAFMAVYLKKVLECKGAIVISDNDLFATEAQAAFADKASRIGLKIQKNITFESVDQIGDDFVSSNITDEDKKASDTIVIFAHTDAGLKITKQLSAKGIDYPVFGPNSFTSPAFTDPEADYTQSAYAVSPFLYQLSNEKAYKFAEEYRTRYKEEPSTTAPLCADAILMLSEAFKAKGTDKNAIREFLSGLKLNKAIDGLSGRLFFDTDNSIDRDMFVSYVDESNTKVAFWQLLIPRDLNLLENKASNEADNIVEVDDVSYNLVEVIYVGLDFIRITDIDPRTMSFEAETFLWYKWMGDKVNLDEVTPINLLKETNKYVIKENLKGDIKYRCYQMKASYQIPFDLTRFPFDTQYLPIYLTHKDSDSTDIMFVMDSGHMSTTPITDITPPEWNYKARTTSTMLYNYDSTFGNPDYRGLDGKKTKVYFSTVKTNVIVERKLFPYLFNLFLPLIIIIAITMLVISIPVEQFVLRINVSMTALMSILVYYMAQKSVLPRVGYLMKSDYYFILAFLFILAIQIVNVVIVNILINKDKKPLAEKVNKYFSIYFVAAAILSYLLITVLL